MGEKDSQRLTTLTISGPYSRDEVSPLDDTALVTAVSIPSSEAIGNHSTGADDDWTDQIRGIVGEGDETKGTRTEGAYSLSESDSIDGKKNGVPERRRRESECSFFELPTIKVP